MTLKTGLQQPHLPTQKLIDAWWQKRPPVRVRAVRGFQIVNRDEHGITEHFQVPPGTVLDVNPLLAQELCEFGKAVPVDGATEVTKPLPGPDRYGWQAYEQRLLAERAQQQRMHSPQAILAALAGAVNQVHVRDK